MNLLRNAGWNLCVYIPASSKMLRFEFAVFPFVLAWAMNSANLTHAFKSSGAIPTTGNRSSEKENKQIVRLRAAGGSIGSIFAVYCCGERVCVCGE